MLSIACAYTHCYNTTCLSRQQNVQKMAVRWFHENNVHVFRMSNMLKSRSRNLGITWFSVLISN